MGRLTGFAHQVRAALTPPWRHERVEVEHERFDDLRHAATDELEGYVEHEARGRASDGYDELTPEALRASPDTMIGGEAVFWDDGIEPESN